ASLFTVGCATSPPKPEVDAAGLVRLSGKMPGNLFAHPQRSIDDYDDILVGDMRVSYAPKQAPLSEEDTRRLRMMVYDVVTTQIPGAGQLQATTRGRCTVKLDVQLSDLEFPKPGSRDPGDTTVTLEFRDAVTGDPIVRYSQHRDLGIPPSQEPGNELERL